MKFVNTNADLIEVGKLENACKKIANEDAVVEVKRVIKNGKVIFVCKIKDTRLGTVTVEDSNPTLATKSAVNKYLDLTRKNDSTKLDKKRSAQTKGKTVRKDALNAEFEGILEDEEVVLKK